LRDLPNLQYLDLDSYRCWKITANGLDCFSIEDEEFIKIYWIMNGKQITFLVIDWFLKVPAIISIFLYFREQLNHVYGWLIFQEVQGTRIRKQKWIQIIHRQK
jgi:hypothetical protein